MKTKTVLTFLAVLFSLAVSAQVHNWTSINTGYLLTQGKNRFIVTPNCLYYFSTNHSTLIRSTDRGLTWDSLYVHSDSSHHEYVDMCFVNDSVGYLAGHDGSHHHANSKETSVVKKTLDRGQTWQNMSNGIIDNSLLTHINFFDANNGLVFGTGNFKTHRFTTQNGGSNWSYFQDNTGPNAQIGLQTVHRSSFTGNHGFVSGFEISGIGKIAQTHDGGQSWSTYKLNSGPITALHFFNGSNGIVVLEDSLLVTTDGGMSFTARREFPYTNVIRSSCMIDMQRGFFCTPTDIYYTPDAGITWSLSYSSAAPLMEIKVKNNYVYAATFNDSIVLKLDISMLVSVSKNGNPDSNISVFPNPSTEHVYIQILGNRKPDEVYISDPLGRLVRVAIISETQEVDIRGLDPGIYSLRILAEGRPYYIRLVIAEY